MHIVKNREKTKHLGEKQPVDEKHPKCPGLCRHLWECVLHEYICNYGSCSPPWGRHTLEESKTVEIARFANNMTLKSTRNASEMSWIVHRHVWECVLDEYMNNYGSLSHYWGLHIIERVQNLKNYNFLALSEHQINPKQLRNALNSAQTCLRMCIGWVYE